MRIDYKPILISSLVLLIACGTDEGIRIQEEPDQETPSDTTQRSDLPVDTTTDTPMLGDDRPAQDVPRAEDLEPAEDIPSGEDTPPPEDTSPIEDTQLPADCSAIDEHPDWEVCGSGPGICEAVFDDHSGCLAVCAAVGMDCHAVWENVDDQCMADLDRPPLQCEPESGHQSDYCVCLTPGACTPDCAGKACGLDGCGGPCGSCGEGGSCVDGQCACVPLTCDDALLHCGAGHDDGCGGTFSCPGQCPPGIDCVEGLCGGPPPPCLPGDCPAFPGAEGEGAQAKGGRGGDVCSVTHTSDSGAGSLRACSQGQGGPRTVIFDVGGIITLSSPVTFSHDDLTLAGQTAPGDGIVIRGYDVRISADDVIIQHLRFRPGDLKAPDCPGGGSGYTEDGLTVSGQRIIVDHVSASWGLDENLSCGTPCLDVTVQYCIIAEGLYQSGLWHGECNDDYEPGGPKGHSMGSLFKPNDGDGTISIHHNLYAHNGNRNPAVGTYETDQKMRADIRNNLIYDCPSMGYTSGDSQEVKVNYVGNYGVFGPDSSSHALFKGNADNNPKIHQSDNRLDDDSDTSFDGTNDGWDLFSGDYDTSGSPFSFPGVTTHASTQVPELVLTWAGARPWGRDAPDAAVVESVYDRDGGLIDSQSEVGGWGTVDPGTQVQDQDGDGMPDAWEAIYGTNPAQADNNGDLDGDGYTNLEEYLHWAARPTQ